MNRSEFQQGAAAAVGPGAGDDLDYRLTQAHRAAVEHGAPAEQQPRREADRLTTAVQPEPALPIVADPRTHPVSFDISAHRAPHDGEIELLRESVGMLRHRLETLESIVRDLNNQWRSAQRAGLTPRKDT